MLRFLDMVQARDLIPFRELFLPLAGNADRWAPSLCYCSLELRKVVHSL